jgi:hypothetical protein
LAACSYSFSNKNGEDHMDRRSVLTAGALGALAAAARAGAQGERPAQDADAGIAITHVYASEDGESHLETVAVRGAFDQIPLTAMVMNAYRPQNVDWHVAPARQFAMNITGELEVEVSDGTKRVIGPGDPVFIADTTGKGHITRLLSPVTFVFLIPPEDWDFQAWARKRAV